MPPKAQFTPAQVVKVLKKHKGNRTAAAAELGLSGSRLGDLLRAAKLAGKEVPVAPSSVAKDPTLVAELKDLRKAVKQLTKLSEYGEKAVDYLEALGIEAAADKTPPEWTLKAMGKPSDPGVPTLFLSDLHWGETVFPAQIGGVNKYNLEIAHARMDYTVETAIHLCRILDQQAGNANKLSYPGIVLPLGGDMISGHIHEELAQTNELDTIPTVLDLRRKLRNVIYRLLKDFPAVFLPCVTGNHGRNTKKVQFKNRHHTSFDWMLYQLLADDFRDDPRVTFNIPDGPDALYRIFSTRYLLTHGDQFRAGDSIIGPIGPLMRGNQKKTARNQAVDRGYDVMLAGHWHQYMHLRRLIVNGSMKGYDEYADGNNFGFEEPTQALWVTHPRYGINWRMPVICEKLPKKPRQTAWVATPSK
jgi:hypothetical protein